MHFQVKLEVKRAELGLGYKIRGIWMQRMEITLDVVSVKDLNINYLAIGKGVLDFTIDIFTIVTKYRKFYG